MNTNRNTILLFIFYLILFETIAQTSADFSSDNLSQTKDSISIRKFNLFTQAKFESGGVFNSLEENGIDHYYGLDLRAGWQKNKNSIYSTLYRGPKFGFGFYSGSFKTDVYGEPNALYGFIDIPFSYPQRKWNFNYSIGLGVAFNFNYFDPVNNPDNSLIGSNKNVYISFDFIAKYNITPHLIVGAGFGIKHFSNGRLHLPNRGINLVPLSLMTEYNFGRIKTDFDRKKIPEFIPFNMINILAAVGNKNFEYGKAVYFKSTLSVNFLRQFHYKYRYGVGAELFYTSGSLDRVTEDKSDFNKLFSYGISGLWEWTITERFYIPISIGVHLNHNVENFEVPLYSRLGLRYLIGKQKNIVTGVSLKMTEFHADYVEWTLGYTFKNDKNTYELLF